MKLSKAMNLPTPEKFPREKPDIMGVSLENMEKC